MSETSPPTVPATSEPQPKQSRSAQDKIIEAYIADAKKFLKVASEDQDIRPILEAHGYDAEEFTTGDTLATAASTAFEGRASGSARRDRGQHGHGERDAQFVRGVGQAGDQSGVVGARARHRGDHDARGRQPSPGTEQEEAGHMRAVQCEVAALAFEREARLIAAARPGMQVKVTGFLAGRSRESKQLVLHATNIEFAEGV